MDDPPIARLADFGFSVSISHTLGTTGNSPGTPGFVAPELLESLLGADPRDGPKASVQADMYAFASVLYQVCILMLSPREFLVQIGCACRSLSSSGRSGMTNERHGGEIVTLWRRIFAQVHAQHILSSQTRFGISWRLVGTKTLRSVCFLKKYYDTSNQRMSLRRKHQCKYGSSMTLIYI